MGADRIELAGERIEFINSRSARLTAASLKTLDAVAAVMKQYPTVRIRIEVGVEQSRGSARRARAGDMRLATDRAAAVQATLLSRGVKAQQVDVAPLGSDRPLDAKRPRDPRLNRRVEFIRVTQ
jgi:outer membrane protein OmpA-like peptidoglycan-associated protein